MRECEKGQEAGEGAQSPQGHHKLFRTLPTVIKCLHWGALPSPSPSPASSPPRCVRRSLTIFLTL